MQMKVRLDIGQSTVTPAEIQDRCKNLTAKTPFKMTMNGRDMPSVKNLEQALKYFKEDNVKLLKMVITPNAIKIMPFFGGKLEAATNAEIAAAAAKPSASPLPQIEVAPEKRTFVLGKLKLLQSNERNDLLEALYRKCHDPRGIELEPKEIAALKVFGLCDEQRRCPSACNRNGLNFS